MQHYLPFYKRAIFIQAEKAGGIAGFIDSGVPLPAVYSGCGYWRTHIQ
jgi:hypothetical protein